MSGLLTKCAATATPRSAYVHLPFCKRKCFYCDFPVVAVGSQLSLPRVQARFNDYLQLLFKELEATPVPERCPLKTIYFGGGTPSLLPPPALHTIIEALDKRFGIAGDAEVSLEADPGTFDVQRLRDYQSIGINRVSIGVQAFQEDLLEACGRAHTLPDVYHAIEAVHASGMPSWSLDLISGLPKLTLEAWQHSLDEAVKAGPTHISTYDLQVEEGTPFARWYSEGQAPLPQDSAAADMYSLASRKLRQAGFEHYEVSNYAKPGHRCSHNQVYWRSDPYYAFGLGAASYVDRRRFTRPTKMKLYADWVSRLAAGECTMASIPTESEEEVMLDTVMLSLRTTDGLHLGRFGRQFGEEAALVVRGALEKHVGHGLVLPLCLSGGGLQAAGAGLGHVARLRDPEGFLLSNTVIADVFAALGKVQASCSVG